MKTIYIRKKYAILFLFFMTACEHGYEYKYSIYNNTDSIATVHFSTFSKDSEVTVAPKETKELFTTSHGIKGSGGPFRRDITKDIKQIIINLGTNKTDYNLRRNEFWIFKKKTSFKAEYKTAIKAEDSLHR